MQRRCLRNLGLLFIVFCLREPANRDTRLRLTGALCFLAIFALSVSSIPACYAAAQQSLNVGGVSRTYYIYVPKSYSASTKAPVVFVLHPFLHDAAWAEHNMGWDQCADKNGFLVVYGQSAADRGSWNAGLTRSERATGYDDVAYLEAVIDAVEGSYTVDMSHVYMVGFSAGAFMTAKMGATIPNSLTAIATVEGMTGLADQDTLVPTSPLSIIMFRGTSDDVVPYTSDQASSLFHIAVYSATGSASDWAQADGCSSTPATSKVNDHITLTDYTGGAGGAEVRLMTVNGGKHEYKPEDTDLIWAFFATQSKATQKP